MKGARRGLPSPTAQPPGARRRPLVCAMVGRVPGVLWLVVFLMLARQTCAGCDGWCTEEDACDAEDCGACCAECFSSCFDCTTLEAVCGAKVEPVEQAVTAAPKVPLSTDSTTANVLANPSQPPPSPPRVPAASMGLRKADYWVEHSMLHTNAWWDPMAGGRGTELVIKGASWSGLERRPCMPGGASEISLREGANLLRTHNLNAVRLPLAVDGLLTPRVSPATCLPADNKVWLYNPFLAGALEYIEVLAKVVDMLGEYGLLVMLDVHVMEAGKWPDNGRVGGRAGAERLLRAWRLLASRFCDPEKYWHVALADLKNEPHGMHVRHAAPAMHPPHSTLGSRETLLADYARALTRPRVRPVV